MGQKKTDIVRAFLEKKILLGELTTGDTISELTIAETCGCSQTTVREVLFALERDGLLARVPFKYSCVSLPGEEETGEMHIIRRYLELRGLAEIHRNALLTKENFEALAALESTMTEELYRNDPYTYMKQDIEFHMTLFNISGFFHLSRILYRTLLNSHRCKHLRKRPEQVRVTTHRPLIDVLLHPSLEEKQKCYAAHIDADIPQTIRWEMPGLSEIIQNHQI